LEANVNNLTGDFDLAVEVTAPAIQRLVEGMHGAGIFRHLFVRAYQNRHVELIINCPQISLVPAGPPDNITRATAASRVLYHSRNISDATDAGLSVIADVTVRVKLYLTNGDPAPLNSNTYLAADWSETTAADINVYSPDPNVVTEVQGALIDFIASEGGGSFPVPALGTTQPITSLAFQFIQSYGNWAAVGLNAGPNVKGSKQQLRNPFVQLGEDWALAISSDYTISQILSALTAQLGALPPPYGPNPVLLSDASVCVLPNPFGGCIASADQKVYLESLNISLQNGQIAINGTLSQITYVIIPITITANFQASATLSIGPNQSFLIDVSQPSIQLQQWYAQLLNSVLGGAFTNAISNGIQVALQSSGGTALSDIFSVSALQSLTSLGGAATVGMAVSADSVSITQDAIIVQGRVTVQNLNVSPVADVVAVRGPTALALNLDALGSWSPAHHVTSFNWDFGDGSPQFSSSDTVPAVAVSHTWPAPGTYVVVLRVSNESGASSSIQYVVKPGVLELLAPQANNLAGPWAVCAESGDFPVTFTVLASGYPAPDASVVIRTSTSPDKIATAYTNQLGIATFTVNNSMFTAPPPSGSAANLVGGMLVNAFCTDYIWAWNYLWLWDCITIINWPQQLMKTFTNELMKLREFSSSSLSAAPGLAQDLGLTHSLLTNLAQMAARGSEILPLDMLLGSKRGSTQREHLEAVTEKAVKNLQTLRSAAEKELQARKNADKHVGLIERPKVKPVSAAERKAIYDGLASRLRGVTKDQQGKQLPAPTFKVSPQLHSAHKDKPRPEK
jgi:hypothetical protein